MSKISPRASAAMRFPFGESESELMLRPTLSM
jgi:hypothetical protein